MTSSAPADTARDAAAAAAEAIRVLSHATQHRDDFNVSDVDAITASLAVLQTGLRQSAEQLAGILEHRLATGQLRQDPGARFHQPLQAISAACAALRAVGDWTDDAGATFAAVQEYIAQTSEPVTAP